jgi:predicted component of type VI protein secretion system
LHFKLYARLAVPDATDVPSLDNPTYGTVLKNLGDARTLQQLSDALLSIPPVLEANYARLQTTRPEFQLVMREGVEGGVITKSEYLIAKAATEMKVPKRVTNTHLATLRHPDFDKSDIRFNAIEQIEHLISKAHDGGTIQEFDLSKEEDGEQELKLIVRLLRQIIEDLLADPRFKDCQYVSFEIHERDGVRIFGAANGGVWWQLNAQLIGPENVPSCL